MFNVYRFVLLALVTLMTVDSWKYPYERRLNTKMYSKDPCKDYYCSNGGTCIATAHCDLHGKRRTIPKCECTGSWRGQRCDENPCSNYNCNTGECLIKADGSPSCCGPDRCRGKTCSDENNSTCLAANGECVKAEKCDRNNTIDVPCCDGNVCCKKETCVTAEGTCTNNTQSTGACATECTTGFIEVNSATGFECCAGLKCCTVDGGRGMEPG